MARRTIALVRFLILRGRTERGLLLLVADQSVNLRSGVFGQTGNEHTPLVLGRDCQEDVVAPAQGDWGGGYLADLELDPGRPLLGHLVVESLHEDPTAGQGHYVWEFVHEVF